MVGAIGLNIEATILANPEGSFPFVKSTGNVYFVTDDWVNGANLMGLDVRRISKMQARNVKDAAIVAGVSEQLLDELGKNQPLVRTIVLPNGCEVRTHPQDTTQRPLDVPNTPYAILVGQVNERLDLDAIRAVANTGLAVVVVGPRTDRNADFGARLENLFAHHRVWWIGPRPLVELRQYLVHAEVGLTPYVDNQFNRASFPLKTLDYLAAGLPALSTDLPSARWLNTEYLAIASSAIEFGTMAHQIACANGERSTDQRSKLRQERILFAKNHSWEARAEDLLRELDKAGEY